MRFRLEARPDEIVEKGTELIKALVREVRAYSPDLAESLEKALPAPEQTLKYPALQGLADQTRELYARTLEAMVRDIGKVLDRSTRPDALHIEKSMALPDDAIEEVWKGYRDQLPGGLADKRTPDDFDADALAQGIKVELEHTDDRALAREIAMDHLAEDPGYYRKLATIEKALDPTDDDLEILEKAAGHKYIRRIPTGDAKRPWRYVYRADSEHMGAGYRVGDKVQVTSAGHRGHYEVVGHEDDKLQIRHDESGRTLTVSPAVLREMAHQEHGQAAAKLIEERVENLRARTREAIAAGRPAYAKYLGDRQEALRKRHDPYARFTKSIDWAVRSEILGIARDDIRDLLTEFADVIEETGDYGPGKKSAGDYQEKVTAAWNEAWQSLSNLHHDLERSEYLAVGGLDDEDKPAFRKRIEELRERHKQWWDLGTKFNEDVIKPLRRWRSERLLGSTWDTAVNLEHAKAELERNSKWMRRRWSEVARELDGIHREWAEIKNAIAVGEMKQRDPVVDVIHAGAIPINLHMNALERDKERVTSQVNHEVVAVKRAGFSKALEGLRLHVRGTGPQNNLHPHLGTGGEYYVTKSWKAVGDLGAEHQGDVTLYSGAFRDEAPTGVLTHELGHRFYYRNLSENARAGWEEELSRHSMVVTPEESDRLLGQLEAIATDHQGRKSVRLREAVDRLAQSSEAGRRVAQYLVNAFDTAAIYDGTVSVDTLRETFKTDVQGKRFNREFITWYGGSNPSEAFAEAFKLYVRHGPRALPEWTRSFFERIVKPFQKSDDEPDDFQKAGGPFIGPRGGKWADAAHTIPWKEPEAQPTGAQEPHGVPAHVLAQIVDHDAADDAWARMTLVMEELDEDLRRWGGELGETGKVSRVAMGKKLAALKANTMAKIPPAKVTHVGGLAVETIATSIEQHTASMIHEAFRWRERALTEKDRQGNYTWPAKDLRESFTFRGANKESQYGETFYKLGSSMKAARAHQKPTPGELKQRAEWTERWTRTIGASLRDIAQLPDAHQKLLAAAGVRARFLVHTSTSESGRAFIGGEATFDERTGHDAILMYSWSGLGKDDPEQGVSLTHEVGHIVERLVHRSLVPEGETGDRLSDALKATVNVEAVRARPIKDVEHLDQRSVSWMTDKGEWFAEAYRYAYRDGADMTTTLRHTDFDTDAFKKMVDQEVAKALDRGVRKISRYVDEPTEVVKAEAPETEPVHDFTKPIADRDGRAYQRVKSVLQRKGYSASDFEPGGALYGWSVNELIELARKGRDAAEPFERSAQGVAD